MIHPARDGIVVLCLSLAAGKAAEIELPTRLRPVRLPLPARMALRLLYNHSQKEFNHG
jgi:hypothetical protein